MKKSNSILIKVLAIIVLFTINSCIDFYEITTRVNADGSLDRTIRVMASDSLAVFKGNIRIPHPGDTNWAIVSRWHQELDKDSKPIKKYEYIATRHFKNSEELNSFLKVNNDTTTEIGVNVEIKKQFRWFYTFVTYTETYKKSIPFNHYPIGDFMSDSDLSFIYDDNFTYSREEDKLIHIKDLKVIPTLNHSDSIRKEQLEKQKMVALYSFISKNIVSEYLNLVAKEYSSISKEKHDFIMSQKEEVLNFMIKEENLEALQAKKPKDPFDKIDSMLNIKGKSLEELNPTLYKDFSKKASKTFDCLVFDEKIKCSTIMPGALLQTNADSIAGSQTYWNINERYFFAKDHQLIAKSRLVNKWAFILSGFIALGLLILVFRKYKP